ncbi:MAG: endolytic transglycosylase MltG [Clostridia bacterium]|nr:endolytic transglycosylase MltG [Clostridia bacterium]
MKKFFLVVLLLFLIAGVGGFFFLPDYLSKSHNSEDYELLVPSGATLTSIGNKLYEEGVIKSKLWFRFQGEEIATKIKPGTYTIEAGATIEEIYEIIQQGEKEIPIIVTFPEGFILYQFAQKIEEAGLGTVDDFITSTDAYFKENYSDEVNSDDLYFKLEGYLFPDTYHFSSKQNLSDVIGVLVKTMEDLWTEEMYSKMNDLGLTKHQVLTIASLIEREAYNDEERETISGVIFNRIDTGMPLQIDATVIYGIGEGKEHMTRVLYADLERQNPYNTYMNKDLPPGPIASPGKNSIMAALNPLEHDYFYYVLGEDGHVFAKTYQEHLRNVENYRKNN